MVSKEDFKDAYQLLDWEEAGVIEEYVKQKEKRIKELEELCSEAMGEQPKEWRDRFRKLLKK
ncbi:MAG: hypothetical protein COB15_09655 [Flavobacteriales bacterium]|nr:MAG: hypothetical protein COB15_09655 [Flavobacteriales bacterium]